MNTSRAATRACVLAHPAYFTLRIGGILVAATFSSPHAEAAGVTVITHGYNANAEGWVTGMADQIPSYRTFRGTSSTIYEIALTYDGSSYYFQVFRPAGSVPTVTDSGEIIVKLDWSQVAGGFTAPYNRSTYEVANVATCIFMQTNAIAELNGHALVEFPVHLIGHSRGGSLVTEMSRLFGINGIWVDHLTTLDPHPLNNDGNFELFMPTDASALPAYANVLFRDNCWQDQGDGLFVPNGEAVDGAYGRYLYYLTGGYSSTHSDVHLWYHGTVDERNPVDDTEAQLTASEFGTWYTSYENYGMNAGFKWSLLGRGDRTSFDQPEGIGYPAIRDGYNQNWNLGAGIPQTPNRTALGTITGNWPNVIRFNLLSPTQAEQGAYAQFTLYYQWAQPPSSNATLSLYLDDDFNPYNANDHLIQQGVVRGSGVTGATVSYWDNANPLVASLTETNAPVGYHSIYAAVSGGGKTRYLYAPETIEVLPTSAVPPVLNISPVGTNLLLYWTTNATGFSLLSTTNLALPNAWVTSSQVPVVLGADFVVTNAMDRAQKFYKLKK